MQIEEREFRSEKQHWKTVLPCRRSVGWCNARPFISMQVSPSDQGAIRAMPTDEVGTILGAGPIAPENKGTSPGYGVTPWNRPNRTGY
jgi:hypothetical protein